MIAAVQGAASIADPPFQGHYVGARRYTAEALSDPGHYARPLPTISSQTRNTCNDGQLH